MKLKYESREGPISRAPERGKSVFCELYDIVTSLNRLESIAGYIAVFLKRLGVLIDHHRIIAVEVKTDEIRIFLEGPMRIFLYKDDSVEVDYYLPIYHINNCGD